MTDDTPRGRPKTRLRSMVVVLVAFALAVFGGPLAMTGALAAPAFVQTGDAEETPKADEDDSRPRIGREDGEDEEAEDGAETESESETATESAVEDGVYESPNYGYRIEFDPAVWQLQGEDDNPDDVYDRLFLTNEISLIGIFGDPDYEPENLDQCLTDYMAGLEDNEANSDIEPLDDPDAEGSEAERSWTTLNYVYEFEDGEQVPYTRYFECIALGDGVTLVIVQDTPADEYATEVEAREDLLRGFNMGSGPSDEPSDEPTDEPVEEPSTGEVYESPQYGYQLEFDPGAWEILGEDDDPDDPYDRISLTNEVSAFTFFGDPDYAPDELDQCVADYAANMEANENISEIEPLDEPDAEGEEEGRVWETYTYLFTSTSGDEAQYVRYFECRALADDLAFVIIQTVPAEDYAAEIAAREDLLQGLTVGEGPAADADADESPTPERSERVDDEQALADAIETFPVTDASHTDAPVEYEQTPPVGGPHHDVPQDCGFYDEPVINEHAVHSLEHGAVWITYDPDLPAEEIEILEDLANDEPKVLVSPFEDLPSPVVASAWGVQLQLETADDPLLEDFIETFIEGDQAPEPRAACAGTDATAG